MVDEPVRTVASGDRAAVLACFDETSAAAFSALSRLTAGDGTRALDLLVDTYAFLDRSAQRDGAVAVSARWVIDAAHSVFAAVEPDDQRGDPPVSALDTNERVALSLYLVERRTIDEVAAILDIAPPEAQRALDAGNARLVAATMDGATPLDSIRRNEVWFDDAMRAHARTSVGNGWQASDAPARASRTIGAAVLSPSAPAGVSRFSVGAFATPSPGRLDENAEFVRPGRSRRTVAGIGVGIAAVLVALAVWVSSSSDDNSQNAASALTSSSTSSTNAADTTAPNVTTGVTTGDTTEVTISDGSTVDTAVTTDATGDEELPGFILDPVPPGFVATGGGSLTTEQSPVNWFEVWASPDAARTSGRWFAVLAIDTTDFGVPEMLSTSARRVDVGGNDGVIDLEADGVTELEVEFPGHQQVRIESFGLTDEELIGLAATASFDNDNRPAFGSASHDIVDGLDLVTSRPTTQSFLAYQIISDNTGSRVQYQSADGMHFITVLTSPQAENDLRVASLLSADVHDPVAALATSRVLDIDGRSVHIGAVPTPFKGSGLDPELPFAQWHVGASTVTILGLTDFQTVLAAIPGSHLATAEAWHQILVTRPPTLDAPVTEDTTVPIVEHRGTIGAPTTSSGVEYQIDLSEADVLRLIVNEQRPADPSSSSSAPFSQNETGLEIHPDPDHPLLTVDMLSATIVAVAFDGPPAADALQVTVFGGTRANVAIVQVPGTTLYGAAFAFSEHADYTVNLVDETGNVIEALRP